MKILSLLYIILLSFISTCNTKKTTINEKYPIIITDEKYSNGKSRKIIYYNDSTHRGLIKNFYPSGSVYSEIETEDSIKSGAYRRFYENEELECIGYYKNNFRDSVETCYYKNRTIKTIRNYFNGDLLGAYYEYDSLNEIKNYKFYIPNNKYVLEINYGVYGNKDSLRNLKRSILDTAGRFGAFDLINGVNFNVADTFIDVINVAHPPGFKINAYAFMKNISDSSYNKSKEILFIGDKGNINFFLDRAGKYRFNYRVYISNNIDSLLKIESGKDLYLEVRAR